jgi:hypothetical protein
MRNAYTGLLLTLGLVGVRLVLGLKLEGVGCRTQEHFTVVSINGQLKSLKKKSRQEETYVILIQSL